METPGEIELKRIHIALDQAGTVSGAAKLLGCSDVKIKKAIQDHPELGSYLHNALPPKEIERFARKPLPPPKKDDDSDELAVAEAYKKSEKQLQEGLEGIGVRDPALMDQVLAMRNFGKMHFQSMREMIGGGAAKVYIDLLQDIQKTRDALDGTSLDDLELQQVLREDRSRLVKLALDTFDKIHQAGITAAMVEAKKKEAREAKKKGRPGFAPLLVRAEGDVHVHEAKPEPKQSSAGT